MFVCAALTVLATALTVRLVFRLARRARCGGGRYGSSRALRWLFRALDTTPGQERVIRHALEEATLEARAARSDLHAQRGSLAEAVRSPAAPDLSGVQAAARAAYDRAERAAAEAVRRVHEVLDPLQRERLARILDGSATPWFARPLARFGGPYRGPVSL